MDTINNMVLYSDNDCYGIARSIFTFAKNKQYKKVICVDDSDIGSEGIVKDHSYILDTHSVQSDNEGIFAAIYEIAYVKYVDRLGTRSSVYVVGDKLGEFYLDRFNIEDSQNSMFLVLE